MQGGGIEPPTTILSESCSTTELPLLGAPRVIRTRTVSALNGLPPAVGLEGLGTPSKIRTCTELLLRQLPLPLGYGSMVEHKGIEPLLQG